MYEDGLSDFQLGLVLLGLVAFVAYGWAVIITADIVVPL